MHFAVYKQAGVAPAHLESHLDEGDGFAGAGGPEQSKGLPACCTPAHGGHGMHLLLVQRHWAPLQHTPVFINTGSRGRN